MSSTLLTSCEPSLDACTHRASAAKSTADKDQLAKEILAHVDANAAKFPAYFESWLQKSARSLTRQQPAIPVSREVFQDIIRAATRCGAFGAASVLCAGLMCEGVSARTDDDDPLAFIMSLTVPAAGEHTGETELAASVLRHTQASLRCVAAGSASDDALQGDDDDDE